MSQSEAPKWVPRDRDYFIEAKRSRAGVRSLAVSAHPLQNLSTTASAPSPAAPATEAGAGKANKKKASRRKSTVPRNPLMGPLSAPSGKSKKQRQSVIQNPLLRTSGGHSSSLAGGAAISLTTADDEAKKRSSLVQTGRDGDPLTPPENANILWRPFRSQRAGILAKYTSSSRIPVYASFLNDDTPLAQNQGEGQKNNEAKDNKGKGKGGNLPKAVDSHASRLEQLEAESGVEERSALLSQKEYVAHIEEQHNKLKRAWAREERVVALKIAIQCAKILGDCRVPQCYPSLFVLLSQVLDTFGDFVFARLRSKSEEALGQGAPSFSGGSRTETVKDPVTGRQTVRMQCDFDWEDVAVNAVETCRNWYYKTACIRELVPRLYIDLCLLKNYRFMPHPAFIVLVKRVARGVRGIGDPLVATYARCYLFTRVLDLFRSFLPGYPQSTRDLQPFFLREDIRELLMESIDDFFATFKELRDNNFEQVACVRKKVLTVHQYVDLFSPALEYLFKCVGYLSPSEDALFDILDDFRAKCNDSCVLFPILASFPYRVITDNADTLSATMKDCESNTEGPRHRLYIVLGRALSACPPSDPAQRLAILNSVWKVVTKIQELEDYLSVAAVFMKFVCTQFTEREANIFLKDILKHIKKAEKAAHDEGKADGGKPVLTVTAPVCQEKLRLTLVSLGESLAGEGGNPLKAKPKPRRKRDPLPKLFDILAVDNFLPVLDHLRREDRVLVCKAVVSAFVSLGRPTRDPVIVHTILDLARTLHDSIDSLSYEEERRHISRLLCGVVRAFEFGRDLEAQLNVYVECRAAFTGLDAAIQELVVRGALLAMRAHTLTKGQHTKKTAAFTKACLAFCHITIPGLDNVFARLQLFLHCAEVALTVRMNGQAEGFLKSAIAMLPAVPAFRQRSRLDDRTISTLPFLLAYTRNLASFLLLFPGPPVKGPFYLVNSLLLAVSKYPHWQEGASLYFKGAAFLSVFQLMCGMSQRQFAYRIDGVDSNDKLYGGAKAYVKQLKGFLGTLMDQIVDVCSALGKDAGDVLAKQKQSLLCLDTINAAMAQLQCNKSMATLVVRLFELVVAGRVADHGAMQRYLRNTVQHLGQRRGAWFSDIEREVRAIKGLEALL